VKKEKGGGSKKEEGERKGGRTRLPKTEAVAIFCKTVIF
jgi:hypothetical protein